MLSVSAVFSWNCLFKVCAIFGISMIASTCMNIQCSMQFCKLFEFDTGNKLKYPYPICLEFYIKYDPQAFRWLSMKFSVFKTNEYKSIWLLRKHKLTWWIIAFSSTSWKSRVHMKFGNLIFNNINTMHSIHIVNKFSHQIFDCIHFRYICRSLQFAARIHRGYE